MYEDASYHTSEIPARPLRCREGTFRVDVIRKPVSVEPEIGRWGEADRTSSGFSIPVPVQSRERRDILIPYTVMPSEERCPKRTLLGGSNDAQSYRRNPVAARLILITKINAQVPAQNCRCLPLLHWRNGEAGRPTWPLPERKRPFPVLICSVHC